MAEARKCVDCACWRGRCVLGKRNKVASDDVCEKFKPKGGKFEPIVICDFLRYTH